MGIDSFSFGIGICYSYLIGILVSSINSLTEKAMEKRKRRKVEEMIIEKFPEYTDDQLKDLAIYMGWRPE